MIPYFESDTGLGTLYCGDCLEIMPYSPDKAFDMVLCDLPYGTTACKWDTIIPFEPLWEQYKRLIKDNRAIVLTASQPFTSALVMSNIKMFKYEFIWDKVRPSGFQIVKYTPMKRQENILVIAIKTPFWNKQMCERKKPIKGRVCSMSDSSPLKHNDGKTRTYTHRNPQSILLYNKSSDGKYLHPTQKPVALFEYLIKTYTNKGDIVLDNCAGSGTTGVACENLNRKYVLIEQDEKYCEIASERIRIETNQRKLF